MLAVKMGDGEEMDMKSYWDRFAWSDNPMQLLTPEGLQKQRNEKNRHRVIAMKIPSSAYRTLVGNVGTSGSNSIWPHLQRSDANGIETFPSKDSKDKCT